MLSSETKRRIDSCRDILVGQLPLPTDQVELITLALIYKFMDDLDEQSVQLGGKRSFFIKELADFRWRSLMPQTVSAADRVRLFADGLEALGDPETGKHLPEMFRDIFRNAMLKFRDGRILSLFLTELDGFAYSHSEELGNAFEYLLQSMGAQGDNGQFRTPRHIIDFIVEVLEPKPEDKILDPACGTGGFLVSAYKHILGKHTSKGSSVPGDQLSPAKKDKLAQQLNGYDITPMMVKLSKVNMFLHGFSDPQIHEYDTLSNDARWNEKYDLIMANPPFMTPKGGVVPHTKFRIAAKKAEVLFTDYIAEHLSTNGRAGIIVPEGIIFQSATAYKALRKFLVEDSLVAVIALPSGVFNPYSGVKTSILILDKGLARQSDSIAFFKVENDGYDLGAQRRPIDKNDLPGLTKEIQEYLEKLRTGKEISVKDEAQIVQKEKIAANGEHNLGGDRYCKEDKQRSLDVEWVAIGALCELFNGRAFKPEEWEKPENGGIPIVRIQNLNNRESAFNYYSGETSEKNTIENGELLFSWSGSRGTSFGAHIWGGGRAVLNQHIFKVVFNPTRILKEYFYYALNEAVSEVEDNLHGGVGLVHITKGNLEKIEIPLPPLEVQKEIVAEIEGYQMVIDGARSVVENYKPQIPIDPKWQLADLESVCTFQEGPGILAKDFRQSGIPLVRLAGLTTGTVTLQGCDYLEPNMVDDRWSHFRLKQGDILVSTSASFGRPARVTTEAEGAVFYTGLIRFSPLVPALKSHFMEAFLGSTYFLKQAESLATGSSIRHFGPKHLRQMKMPLPPPEAQLEIIADLKKEKEMVEANKELSARFEKKIQAVMARVWGNGTAE